MNLTGVPLATVVPLAIGVPSERNAAFTRDSCEESIVNVFEAPRLAALPAMSPTAWLSAASDGVGASFRIATATATATATRRVRDVQGMDSSSLRLPKGPRGAKAG